METLSAMQNRVSVAKLKAPAPSQEELNECFKAAFRAADHGKLQPRRFLLIEGQGLDSLASLFVSSALQKDPQVSPSLLERFKSMPHRAPLIIVAIAVCQENPKVPESEQLIACGAAVQNLLNGLFALGYGAIWRSGEFAEDLNVAKGLGLANHERVIGFIYCGTPDQEFQSAPTINLETLVSSWP